MTTTQLPPFTEKRFQAQIVTLARTLGWAEHHTYDSRRSPAGFPDLVLLRPPRLILAEVKTDAGRMGAFAHADPGVGRSWWATFEPPARPHFVWDGPPLFVVQFGFDDAMPDRPDRAEAERRARRLLNSRLTPYQRRMLRTRGCFFVQGASGKKYRVSEIRDFNVRAREHARDVRYCAGPEGDVPLSDHLLAQVLMLRDPDGEREFLEVANSDTLTSDVTLYASS